MKKPARFHAISNGGGWGQGFTIAEAVKKSVKESWSTKMEKMEVWVYELDPQFPITHVFEENGHALHVPKDAKETPSGRFEDERYCYAKNENGKFKLPKVFKYLKGATSDAGKNWDRYVR